jgi:hypothetical protein
MRPGRGPSIAGSNRYRESRCYRLVSAHYRAYIVGEDGHFIDGLNLHCADDGAAIESAKQLVDGHDIELWQEGRMVTKLTTSDEK